jgi:hypothetical protein
MQGNKKRKDYSALSVKNREGMHQLGQMPFISRKQKPIGQ